jgi:hypothetical protein
MLTPIANIHHHKLPRLGEIVTLPGLRRNGINPRWRWIVESYPLSDAADQRYSRGIHTVNLRCLTHPSITRTAPKRVSGFWCESY